MKKSIFLVPLFLISAMLLSSCKTAQNPVNASNNNLQTLAKNSSCTSIQDGTITYSAGSYLAGQPIKTGYDPYGYNYQAHMFKGSYANVYLNGDGLPAYNGNDDDYLAQNPSAASKWYWPYRDVQLIMQWNDAWISNKDCDGDRKLDRHYGFPSYIGSGAWETNHMYGTDESGHWTYFTKIVAVPTSATLTSGIWYSANGKEIGANIWGEFATTQEVESGLGATYVSPAGPGFGKWK